MPVQPVAPEKECQQREEKELIWRIEEITVSLIIRDAHPIPFWLYPY